eukprot:719986-Rhodomonas_salina.2
MDRQVLEVSSTQHNIIVNAGVKDTFNEQSPFVVVHHLCEVRTPKVLSDLTPLESACWIAFTGRPEHLVEALPAPMYRGPPPFVPQEQLLLEQELTERIRKRVSSMGDVDQLGMGTVTENESTAKNGVELVESVDRVKSGEQVSAKDEKSMLSLFSMASTEDAAAVHEKSVLFSEPSLRTDQAGGADREAEGVEGAQA